MVKKLASSEIAESRERFEKVFGEPLFDGFKRDWIGMYYSREARRAWEIWEQAERDTRERIAQLVKRYAEDARSLSSLDDAMDGLNELAERIRGKE